MAEDGTEGAVAKGAGSFDVFFLFDAVNLSAHHTGNVNPHGKAHGHKDLPEAFAEGEGDGNDEEHGGDGPDDVDEPGDEVVNPAAVVGGQCAESDADEQGDEDGDEAHGKADPTAYHEHAEHVAAIGVGAQPEGALLGFYHPAVGHGEGFAGYGDGMGAVALGLAGSDGNGGVGQGAAGEEVAVGFHGVDAEEGGAAAGVEGGKFKVLLVAVGGVVGGDEVAQYCHKNKEPNDHQAGHGEPVAAETSPGHVAEGGALGRSLLLEEAAVAAAEQGLEGHLFGK